MATVMVVQRRMKALKVRTHSKRQPQMPYTSYGHVVECNGCWPLSCAAAAPLLLRGLGRKTSLYIWGHRRICSKSYAKQHRGRRSADFAAAEIPAKRLGWPDVVAIEADVLPAERGNVGEQLIGQSFGLGAKLSNGVAEVDGVPEDDGGDREVEAR